AVSGSGMNNAGALIEGDVSGENAGHFKIQKRMLEPGVLEVMAFEFRKNASFLDVAFRLQSSDTIRRQQELPFFCLNHDVLKIRMKCECAVVRNRPGSRGPKHRRNI